MILTAPPHSRQVSMSMLNTRFKRWAQVMAARRSAGVGDSGSFGVFALFPLPCWRRSKIDQIKEVVPTEC
jgi:hypothetical protein